MAPLDFIQNGRLKCHRGRKEAELVCFCFFFFSPQKVTEADCLLKSLIENLKTETSQQGNESNWVGKE